MAQQQAAMAQQHEAATFVVPPEFQGLVEFKKNDPPQLMERSSLSISQLVLGMSRRWSFCDYFRGA
ncbi:hypothetical protein CR513_12775, partial [Mucuna pruriens]